MFQEEANIHRKKEMHICTYILSLCCVVCVCVCVCKVSMDVVVRCCVNLLNTAENKA